ncbi:MAG: hypothetical protein J6Y91_00840, partial [Alphaproteobacteria bacterium]|nr:hypothetical protein [Alphaproteobacteria bacterium]
MCNGTIETLKFLRDALLVLIIIIFLLLETIVIFNPIVFPFWAMICRKSFGEQVCGTCKNDIDEVYQQVCQSLLLWEIKLFPMWMKRQFVLAGPQLFSVIDQYNVAHELKGDDKIEFVGRISEEARNYLWRRKYPLDRDAVIAKAKKLSEEILTDLIERDKDEVIDVFIEKTTPSSACVKLLMDYACQKNFSSLGRKCLVKLILKHGLSADLIDFAYNLDYKPLTELINDTLVIRNQSLMMDQFAGTGDDKELLWQKFCKDNEYICIDAERKMQQWMFKEF